jgi:hypothetical protein
MNSKIFLAAVLVGLLVQTLCADITSELVAWRLDNIYDIN